MDTSTDDTEKARYFENLNETSTILRTGFIAQDVETTAQSIGYNFDAVHHPVTGNDYYTLGYGIFVVPLVQAVQELASQDSSLLASQGKLKTDKEGQQKINQDFQSKTANISCNATADR